MDVNVNPEMVMNALLLENKESAPIVKVLNKYGVYGNKAFNLILELAVVTGNMPAGSGDTPEK